MKPRRAIPGTIRFIFIAIVFMLLADQFLFNGERGYIEDAKRGDTEQVAAMEPETPRPPPTRATPPDGKAFFESPQTKEPEPSVPAPIAKAEPAAPVEPEVRHAPRAGAPKIAIVIDDVGMDVRRSKEAIALPAPVTLAMLPYAPRTPELAKEGKANGHSLIIHAPMEAMDPHADIGPGGLHAAMSPAQLDAAFKAMLDSFSGYEGINNHMGSRLTQDAPAMDRIMAALAAKHLFFLDSKTTPQSVGAREAAQAGVPYAERDVFIDHVETLDFARAALRKAEALALRRGSAIAIGHPKDVTLRALHEWLPTLAAKGIEIVPVGSLMIAPQMTKAAPQVQAQPAPEGVEPAAGEAMPALPDMFPRDQKPSYRIAE